MDGIKVIKIGGNIVNNKSLLISFLKVFSSLEGAKILVHGGGKKASEVLSAMGIKPVMIDGRRITDTSTLDVVTMVYGGLINKNIVAMLQSEGVNAIGLSGADGNIILSHKRIPTNIDYGYAGDIDKVNVHTLTALIEADLVPVLCPLTHDGRGQILNTNADTIASEVASSLAAVAEVQLIYCFELKGVMHDIEDETSLIRNLHNHDVRVLHNSGIIKDGMIPKLKNGFDAKRKGVKKVSICHFSEMTDEDAGTTLVL
jgi:acetylglutamate kinase